jgi:hypothetical protein
MASSGSSMVAATLMPV